MISQAVSKWELASCLGLFCSIWTHTKLVIEHVVVTYDAVLYIFVGVAWSGLSSEVSLRQTAKHLKQPTDHIIICWKYQLKISDSVSIASIAADNIVKRHCSKDKVRYTNIKHKNKMVCVFHHIMDWIYIKQSQCWCTRCTLFW